MDAFQPPSEERKDGLNLDKNISRSKRDGKDADNWFFDIIGTFNTTSSWKQVTAWQSHCFSVLLRVKKGNRA